MTEFHKSFKSIASAVEFRTLQSSPGSLASIICLGKLPSRASQGVDGNVAACFQIFLQAPPFRESHHAVGEQAGADSCLQVECLVVQNLGWYSSPASRSSDSRLFILLYIASYSPRDTSEIDIWGSVRSFWFAADSFYLRRSMTQFSVLKIRYYPTWTSKYCYID